MAMIQSAERTADRTPAEVDAAATEAYAHLFQAFAEPTRLAIVQHLASGEHRVRDLVDHMGLAQSTVSKHIGFLVECGLVKARLQGRATWYSLAEEERHAALFTAAEALLAATGTAARLCPHLIRSENSDRSVQR